MVRVDDVVAGLELALDGAELMLDVQRLLDGVSGMSASLVKRPPAERPSA